MAYAKGLTKQWKTIGKFVVREMFSKKIRGPVDPAERQAEADIKILGFEKIGLMYDRGVVNGSLKSKIARRTR